MQHQAAVQLEAQAAGLLAEAPRRAALGLMADRKEEGSQKALEAVPCHKEKACLQAGRKEAWDMHQGVRPYRKDSPCH